MDAWELVHSAAARIQRDPTRAYEEHLRAAGYSERTIVAYASRARNFAGWLEGREVTGLRLVQWRDHVREQYEAMNTRKQLWAATRLYLEFLEAQGHRVVPLPPLTPPEEDRRRRANGGGGPGSRKRREVCCPHCRQSFHPT